MTRRLDIVWLDVTEGPDHLREVIVNSGHSRYPACEGDLDRIIGIVAAQRLLSAALEGQALDLRALAQPSIFVPETLPAVQLLDMFYQNGQHMAIVVDEYGGTQGLITVHDLLEAVVGDVTESDHLGETRASRREDGSWLLDGMLPVEDFRELFRVDTLPGEADNAFSTLGGFVMSHLGKIPAVSESFEWGDWRFEVVDMDGHRVDKVLLAPLVTHEQDVS